MLFYLNKRTRGAGGRRVWDLGLNRAPLSGRAISVGLQCVRPALSRLALLARLWTSNERNPMQPVRPTLSSTSVTPKRDGEEEPNKHDRLAAWRRAAGEGTVCPISTEAASCYKGRGR